MYVNEKVLISLLHNGSNFHKNTSQLNWEKTGKKNIIFGIVLQALEICLQDLQISTIFGLQHSIKQM